MTRTDLLTKLARRTNKNTTLDTATQSRLLDFLNERHRRILSMPGMSRLREATTTFASVSGTALYALPNVARVLRMYEATNDRVLYELTPELARQIDPDPQSGTPEAFVWTGRQAVAAQPPAPTQISAVSSEAADTTQRVYIEGKVTGGSIATANATLTGTGSVSLGSLATWERIDKFYLGATTAGNVTLSEDVTSSDLGVIAAGATYRNYWAFRLWPTPSSAITYTVDILREVTDLADVQPPDLEDDFHDVLLLGALMDEYQHMNDSRWGQARVEYETRMAALKYRIAATGARGPGLIHGQETPSQLGSWFPAGT